MKFKLLVICLISYLFFNNIWASNQNNKPAWINKTSWLEGDSLMVVGVSKNSRTKEEGGQTAYENGAREIKDFYDVFENVEPSITNKEAYEEQNEDGTWNVYRLLKSVVDFQ